MRYYVPLVLILPLACFSQTLSTRIYSGSGAENTKAVTTDAAGNIYVVGTTTSFDLPLLNPTQAANTGTQLVFSPDAGVTWQPLGNLPNPYPPYFTGQNMPVAVDPTNPAVFYVASNGMIFKSIDSGRHFSSGVLLSPSILDIVSVVVDPASPTTLYAGGSVGLFKSTDAGATWSSVISGLPASSIYALTIDPFHPKSIWVSLGDAGFISTDGANAWSQLNLPPNEFVSNFAFDPVKPGIVYATAVEHNDISSLLKSTDGGVTWSQLKTPFLGGVFVADPVRSGYLYNLSGAAIGSALFYRSTDGGATWQSSTFPASYASAVLIDPTNPNIVIAGTYRSTDSGKTWAPTAVSRDIRGAFVPKGNGAVFATASITSDLFLAKLAPDGKTLLFATYFGGMGNESATGVQVDASGNVWVAGNTNSFHLPLSKHALQQQLKGVTNPFLAKFSAQGKLVASTYFGSSGADTIMSMKLDSKGDPWLFGQTLPPNFPLKNSTSPPPELPPSSFFVFLAEIDSAASQLLYSAAIAGVDQPGGMTIDAAGDILLTGTTSESGFPLTAGVIHGSSPPNQASKQAVLIKLDGSGKTIFSTYLGGSASAANEGLQSYGVAVTTDGTGIYVTGNTSAIDFSTTPGAYQTKLKGGCQYPSFAVNTGFIGTIYTFLYDDVFVMKLSPDGKKLIYSTLLGGSCYDRPTGIAVTPAGAVFVAGETNSIDFPVIYPLEAAPAIQNYESFVSMLGANGATLPFSSYLLAGSAPTLALGPDGILHIAGATGIGAQSITYSGFPLPLPTPMTDAYLAGLDVSATPAKLDLIGVRNAFSRLPGPIAPGEIIELTVPDFLPVQVLDVGISMRLPLGTNLGGTEVFFDGKPGLVMSVFHGRIVCIAPRDLGENQSTSIQVKSNGAVSNALTVHIAPAALGLLSADGSGQGLANARNIDGTLNSTTNPAKRGARLTVFFTGAGVPPAFISADLGANLGPASIAPLQGFVPGIYAASFETPTNPTLMSPLHVTLSAAGSSRAIAGSTSQSLLVYVK